MAGSLVTAHIDLDAIRNNVIALNRRTPDNCRLMAVVKADGYGHGAVKVGVKALDSGAKWLGVARLEEALPLREAGISAPILVFGYVCPEQAATAARHDLTLTIYDLNMATALSEAAAAVGKPLDVHLKVDTGMGRVGMIVHGNPMDKEARQVQIREIEKIARLPGIRLKGVYTHFAAADSRDKTYTSGQIASFDSLLADLEKQGIGFRIRHAANSAGLIAHPASHYDMVRPGISLYGLPPSGEVDMSNTSLRPAMMLKTIVTAVRPVPKGFCVSYGMTHQTPAETRLASVPIGYADGFSRRFSSNGQVLVGGRRAPIVGRVCMDQTMIDVGHLKDVAPGDEVVVFGCQGDGVIRADELAENAETINYEIVSALTSRVERVYSDSGAGSG